MFEALSESSLPSYVDMRDMAAYQTEYAALAAQYATARDLAIRRITNQTLLVQPSEPTAPGTHELVTWQIDGIVTTVDDNRHDYAQRARMLVSQAATDRRPADVLSDNTISCADLLPENVRSEVVGALGRKGIWLHGMEYRRMPVTDYTGKTGLDAVIPFNRVSIRRGTMLFGADPQAGEVHTFPTIPPFDNLVRHTHEAVLHRIAVEVPAAAELQERLAEAAEADARNPHAPVDRPGVYADIQGELPGHDMDTLVDALAKGLYAQQPDEPLCHELVAALGDPLVDRAAEMALASQWSYRQHQGRGTYTPPLTQQLEVIAGFAPIFHHQFAAEAQTAGPQFGEVLHGQLDTLQDNVNQANDFVGQLGMPHVLSLAYGDWTVRPR